MTPGQPRFRAVTVAIATVAFTASGCSDDEDDAAPAVGDLGVIDVQELDLPFGDAFLSPNGERIATYAETELCVYAATGEQERCVDQELRLDANSIRWNADGTRLVFTENFFVYFDEPDVWTLDAESGDLTNLTDDGVEASGLDVVTGGDETAADIDLVPVWVDDETVRFLRWQRSEDESSVDVMEVSADGGEPENVGSLATQTAPIDIAYTADDRAAYAREDQDDVALSDLSGGDAESISDDTTSMVSASDSGEDLLVMPNPAASDYTANWPTATVVPVDGGAPTEIADSVRWVTWRSGSAGIAYTSVDVEDPREITLWLTADAGSEGREISTGSFLAPYRDAGWRSPVWSTQDTILLMQDTTMDDDSNDEEESTSLGEPFRYVLLHLGTG